MSLIAGPAGKISSVPRIATIVSPPEFALPLLEKRFLWLKSEEFPEPIEMRIRSSR